MYLLAISGGPDSMFLLNKYKNKKIIVAHVNYHKRLDSNIDENIVKKYCIKNNIKFEILNVTKKPKGNFQNWAREVRYDFFKKIYEKYQCTKLLTGHHKDDFLETSLMQQRSGRTPRFFGIKKYITINGLYINRPLIDKYWKNEILNFLKKDQIKYATDSSNAKPIFERNKIRIELKGKTEKEKQSMYSWFNMSNKILVKKFKRVDRKTKKIIESGHDLKLYKGLGIDSKEVMYEIIHHEFGKVKLSSKKIKSFEDFILGKEGNKKFIINNKNYIFKKNNKLSYIK